MKINFYRDKQSDFVVKFMANRLKGGAWLITKNTIMLIKNTALNANVRGKNALYILPG